MKYELYMDDDQVVNILCELKDDGKIGEFYDFTYQWITMKKMLTNSNPDTVKLNAINECINYYAESERYEKCIELKKVSDKINNSIMH